MKPFGAMTIAIGIGDAVVHTRFIYVDDLRTRIGLQFRQKSLPLGVIAFAVAVGLFFS